MRRCSVAGCERPRHRRAFCRRHYDRWLAHGDPLVVLHPGRGGVGRYVDKSGYVWLKLPGHPLAIRRGYVSEHRLVAFEAGLLTDLECDVHHRDEDPGNNDLDNLEVLARGDHRRRHRLGKLDTKTHCPHGHLYDEANTSYKPNGGRRCRACARESWARRARR